MPAYSRSILSIDFHLCYNRNVERSWSFWRLLLL